jgi:hypothetical protein
MKPAIQLALELFGMMGLMQQKAKRFISDSDGHIVLWQSPNLLLSVWIVLRIVTLLLKGSHLKSGLEQLSTAILFAWACFEMTTGVNYFRKTIGILVMVVITAGFFW